MEVDMSKVQRAFEIYAELAARGRTRRLDVPELWEDDDVKLLVQRFVQQVQCALIDDSEYYYLIPLALESPFHISNDTFKKENLPSRAVNMDIYLMYLTIIVLFGCFYDSYETNEPLDFVTIDFWLEQMNQRIEALHRHDEAVLRQMEQAYDFNWVALIQKWEDMDSVKETARKQDSRTNSRVAFLNMTRDFLVRQGLVEDIGNQELSLTEKARIIISRYYMSEEHDRGILDFMYGLDHGMEKKKEDDHASHQ